MIIMSGAMIACLVYIGWCVGVLIAGFTISTCIRVYERMMNHERNRNENK